MIYFAGIGSRSITEIEEYKIKEVCKYLNLITDITCLSGNATGADITFQKNCPKHIALLAEENNNFHLFKPVDYYVLQETDTVAYKSVEMFHPNPSKLSEYAYKLMARNYFQVCPRFINKTKVDFVLYVADEINGEVQGGTGQAIRIAKYKEIPHFNLRYHSVEECIEWIMNLNIFKLVKI